METELSLPDMDSLGFYLKYELITLRKSMQILFRQGTTKSIASKTENYSGITFGYPGSALH